MSYVSGYEPVVRACPRKCLNARRTASRFWTKMRWDDQLARLIRCMKDGRNAKLHALCRREDSSAKVLHDGRSDKKTHRRGHPFGYLPANG